MSDRRNFLGKLFGGAAVTAATVATSKLVIGEVPSTTIRRVNGRWQRGDTLVAVSTALDELGVEGMRAAIKAERQYIEDEMKRWKERRWKEITHS